MPSSSMALCSFSSNAITRLSLAILHGIQRLCRYQTPSVRPLMCYCVRSVRPATAAQPHRSSVMSILKESSRNSRSLLYSRISSAGLSLPAPAALQQLNVRTASGSCNAHRVKRTAAAVHMASQSHRLLLLKRAWQMPGCRALLGLPLRGQWLCPQHLLSPRRPPPWGRSAPEARVPSWLPAPRPRPPQCLQYIK